MTTEDDHPRQPEPGTDSTVQDWFGQSVDRDAELADELAEARDPDEAEEEFAERAQGAETQAARHGESIDPELGEENYRSDDDR